MKFNIVPLSALIPCLLVGDLIIAGVAMNIPTMSTDTTSAIDDTINITVDSSCTMGQTVTSSHTTELNPGETNTTIGQSRIAAYCNDNEGYAIYAIGYTNGEYGNTNLVSTDGNHTIPTGTSGSNSYWNMKLTEGTATGTTSYLPTMVNEFTTNTTIPNDYIKVAYRDSSTISQNQDPTETGSYFTTTYSAHIDTTQPAGIYNGQVQYVMVHPSSAPAPEVPYIMQNTAPIKRKLLNVGDSLQATDIRDGKKYWVTKLADGNIWMTQNLDLDIETSMTYTSINTDLPEGTTWVPSTSTYSRNDHTWVFDKAHPESYDPGDLYWDGMLSTNGSLDDRTVTDPSMTYGGTHYHIGNYYNWTATVAMNDSSSYGRFESIEQSICPAGWTTRGGEYTGLAGSGITSGEEGNIHIAPNYFVYGGYWQGQSGYVGYEGNYWTTHVGNWSRAYYFSTGYPENDIGRGVGFSIRCVAR